MFYDKFGWDIKLHFVGMHFWLNNYGKIAVEIKFFFMQSQPKAELHFLKNTLDDIFSGR